MKKYIVIGIILALLVTLGGLTGCMGGIGGLGGSPSATVKDFFGAVKTGNVQQALEYKDTENMAAPGQDYIESIAGKIEKVEVLDEVRGKEWGVEVATVRAKAYFVLGSLMYSDITYDVHLMEHETGWKIEVIEVVDTTYGGGTQPPEEEPYSPPQEEVGPPEEVAPPEEVTPARAVGKIAFSGPDDKIWIINADGTGAHAVGHGFYPSFSPDGKQIAFCALKEGDYHVATMDVDGTNFTWLTRGYSPAWSPDGRRIAFLREVEDHGLWVMDSDGGNQTRLAPHPVGHIYEPCWSPDGSKIAYYVGTRMIYTIDLDTSKKTMLAEGIDPAWSPDGEKIAFIGGAMGSHMLADWGDTLYVMDADGTDITRLRTFPLSYLSEVVWSPDGKMLAAIDGFSSCLLRPPEYDMEELPVEVGTSQSHLLSISWVE